MRRMYSKKQIEGMFVNRYILIDADGGTYGITVMLPKSVTKETLKDAMPNFIGAGINANTFAITSLMLSYNGGWTLYVSGASKEIKSISIN